MTVTAATRAIILRGACEFPSCSEFAFPLHSQLARGNYDVCSTLTIPETIRGWRDEHRTARKRADRCARRGYTARRIVRAEHADDIYRINTSTAERQGRLMSDGYWQRPSDTVVDVSVCNRHGVHPYGVFAPTGDLVAYLFMYRSGDLALVSQILGHVDHLEAEVMYLLFECAVTFESRIGQGVVVYNRHDSGTDGLRFFKERLGFRAEQVEWLL